MKRKYKEGIDENIKGKWIMQILSWQKKSEREKKEFGM